MMPPAPHYEPERCPMCGSPVRVVSGGEGTAHYEPESERRSLELIAASLALPIVADKMRAISRQAFGGFSTISPNENEALQKRLAPWAQRHRELLDVVLGPAPVHREEGKGS